MASQKIKNLKELREQKEILKQQLESGFDNPLDSIKGILQGFTNGNSNPLAIFDKSDTGRNQLMDEGVKALLTLVASTAVTRFRLGPVPKLLLTTAVAIATPYVVDKIQQKIHKKA